MRVIRWVLIAIGSVSLALGLTCAYLSYEQVKTTETWTVRFPGDLDKNPELVARIRTSLLNRSALLMPFDSPRVHYRGMGAFSVELSAPKHTSEFIARVLADPGEFSVRVTSPGAAAPCDRSVLTVVQSGLVEESHVGFNGEQAPIVLVRLTAPGGEAMRRHSQDNIGNPVSLCLNEQLLLSPVIRSEVGAFLQIDGLKTPEEALALAAILSGGPLPHGAVAERADAA
jgi:hypothetical protein